MIAQTPKANPNNLVRFSVDELVSNFDLLGGWEERYGYLIDLGKRLPPLDESEKIESNFLAGCVSKVWLLARPTQATDEAMVFAADSDSMIVRGLINLLLGLCRDHTPREILAIPFEQVMEDIGLSSHLSPNRRNGFVSMIGRIRYLAGLQAG